MRIETEPNEDRTAPAKRAGWFRHGTWKPLQVDHVRRRLFSSSPLVLTHILRFVPYSQGGWSFGDTLCAFLLCHEELRYREKERGRKECRWAIATQRAGKTGEPVKKQC